MKQRNLIILVALLVVFTLKSNAQEKLHAYYKVTASGTLADARTKLLGELKASGFRVLGSYNPQGKSIMYTVAFTRNDLSSIAVSGKTQRALASVLKFSIYKKSSTNIEVTLLNPEYIFHAYMGDNTKQHAKLKAISNETIGILKKMGKNFTGFGGQLSKSDLKKYHYMMGMPYFTDPIELNEFADYNKACSVIEANLKSKKGNTKKVYQIKFTSSKIAIYGIGLMDGNKGERYFLPIIGQEHLAAMPYEIIVINNKAYMLHGKYRFALLWPELTMSQFMKISSTPGYVEDAFEALTK